ncbi:MAG TPA: ABC transporter permease [Gemmatimonadales bacterium]|nr:ABC transporter permease [Gemmatimonadales bacterium]
MNDIRFAVRSLRRSPTLAIAVVLTLALCIGATTAVFSVVYAVLFRPLPFKDPDGLMLLTEVWKGQTGGSVSVGNWADAKRDDRLFAHLVPMSGASVNLAGSDVPENVTGARVGWDFFQLLGVAPALGRAFLPDEDRPGSDGVVILSDGLWRRRFGADRSVVGREIRIDGAPRQVIGVMPASMDYTLYGEELWLPAAFTPAQLAEHDEHYLMVLGRLRPGVSASEVQPELDQIARGLQERFPRENSERGLAVSNLHEELVGDYRTRLYVLLGAVGFVLLIACANIANLLLARATARSRETAIRAAVGAGRRHIVRHALAESLVLAAAGGLLGVVAAYWGVAALTAIGPADIPRLQLARVDAPVLLFVVALTLLAGLIFGLAPAARMASQLPQEALKEGGRTGSGGRRDRLRSALVVGEIALALVLLTGAGLLIRSAIALNEVDPGFDPRGVLVGRVSLPASGYDSPDVAGQAFERIAEGLAQAPGVTAAGLASSAPFEGSGDNGLIPEGRPLEVQYAIPADFRLVTPGYLTAMGLRLRAGRALTAQDRAGTPRVMLINETLARRAWPGEDPIGKRVACCEPGPDGNPNWKTVVGVIADVHARGLGREAPPEFYLPMAQAPKAAWRWIDRTMTLAVRMPGDPMTAAPAMRDAVWRVDRSLPVYNIATMGDRRSASLASSRFSTLLLTAFGGIALVLAAIGVYGVISYGVTQRAQEIGIRVALGAGRARVLRLVVGHAALLTGIGLVLGLTGAMLLARLMGGLLFRVSPTDPPTLGAGVLVLSGVALVAALLPAERAARLDPSVTLRAE